MTDPLRLRRSRKRRAAVPDPIVLQIRVYLDQFAWIQLLGAREDHSKGEGYHDVLTLLEEAVKRGRVSLPLSSVHYFETANRRPFVKRKALAGIMFDLSQRHAIAPFATLARAEMRQAIARTFGSLIAPASPIPFGRGVEHAFSADLISSYAARAERGGVELKSILEWIALAGVPEQDEARYEAPLGELRKSMQAEADRLEGLRQLHKETGHSKGDALDRIWRASVYVEALRELQAAFNEAGVPIRRLTDGGRPAFDQLLKRMPTMEAQYEFGRLREQSVDKKWTVNDLRDIQALAPALVYADVVVTEKQWASQKPQSARLAKRYGTVLLSDLNDLKPLLIHDSL